jgi:hypothetical protein
VPGQLSPYPRTVSLRYRSEIFGRALRSPSAPETGTKRVYDEYMTRQGIATAFASLAPGGRSVTVAPAATARGAPSMGSRDVDQRALEKPAAPALPNM